MLLDNFYTLIDKLEVDDNWLFNIELNSTHSIYDGHFPNQPIVPGVCNLQIIRECAEDILGQRTFISNVSSCKYLSVVDPSKNAKLQFQLALKESSTHEYLLQASGKFDETDFIKLKATIQLI